MKRNDEGGIEIVNAAVKSDGVPAENWLPIELKDLALNVILRIYAPALEKMKTVPAPQATNLNKNSETTVHSIRRGKW